MTLYCSHCQQGQIVREELRSCPRCGSRFFTTAVPSPPPQKRPFVLTVDDNRFLHSVRIAPWVEETPEPSA